MTAKAKLKTETTQMLEFILVIYLFQCFFFFFFLQTDSEEA